MTLRADLEELRRFARRGLSAVRDITTKMGLEEAGALGPVTGLPYHLVMVEAKL